MFGGLGLSLLRRLSIFAADIHRKFIVCRLDWDPFVFGQKEVRPIGYTNGSRMVFRHRYQIV